VKQLARRVYKIFRDTIDAWREDYGERLAAALSFYAIFSLVPSLVIVIGLTGLIVDQKRVEAQIVEQVQHIAGADVAEFVADVLDNRARITRDSNLFATLLGLATVLFGASGAYAQLQGALNTIWRVRAKPKQGIVNFLRRRLFAFVILLLIGFMLIVSLVFNTWLVLIDSWMRVIMPETHTFLNMGNVVISFGITMLLFAMLYKVMPDVTIRWHDIWVGAGVTSLLFNLGKWGIGLFLGNSTLIRTFGAAGAFVALLIWVYYSAQILLFGAEFIKVFAIQRGRAVLPASHAINVQWTPEDATLAD
jgi:membrane protein